MVLNEGIEFFVLGFYMIRFKNGYTWNMNFDGKNVNPIRKIEKLLHTYNICTTRGTVQKAASYSKDDDKKKRCKTCI